MSKSHFDSTWDRKELSKSVTSMCINVYVTSQILKFVNFTKTLKSRYLKNETFFLQIKKSLITHQRLLYGKNTFVAEVTFHDINSLICF